MLMKLLKAGLFAVLLAFSTAADAGAFLKSRVGVGTSAPAGSYMQAFNSTTAALETWFVNNTGPRVSITNFFSGTYQVNSQADATALSGTRVTGTVNFNVDDVSAADFEVVGVAGVGLSTHYNLLNFVGGVSNINLSYFFVDGLYERAYSGFGGSSYSDNITLYRGEIVRAGDDGGKGFRNSLYQNLYIHDMRPWVPGIDGPYNLSANNIQYPHSDPLQLLRPFNQIYQCWLENTVTDQAISATLWSGDVGQALQDIIISYSYLEGGNTYTAHATPGAGGTPSNLAILNNLVSRTYGNYPGTPFSIGTLPPGAITVSGNLWEDTRTPVP